MKPRRARVFVALGAVALSVAGLAVNAFPAGASGPPSYEPDVNAAGTLTLYNSSGVQISSGAITDSPLATYYKASGPKTGTADVKAFVTYATPQTGVPIPALWTSNEQWTSAQAFATTQAGYPAGLNNPATNVVVKGVATDGPLTNHVAAFPNTTATDPGVYQIRLYTSAAATTYYTADVLVTGSTWQQIYPTVVTATGTTTTLTVSPASPQGQGTNVTLTAAVAATTGPNPTNGSVKFFDGTTQIGATQAFTGANVSVSTTTLSVATHSLTAQYIPSGTTFTGSTSSINTYVITPVAAKYSPVTPCRVFDTRSGKGPCAGSQTIPVGPIAGGSFLSVPITGVAGVLPNATAVVLNVTAVGASAPTFVSVYPDGAPRPTVSNLNVSSASAVPNLVVVPVENGKIDFFNAVGSVNVIADLAGFYSPSATQLYTPVGPCRVFDTRSGKGPCSGSQAIPVGAVGAAGVLTVPITGVASVPPNATAVVLNVTATGASAKTFISVYPDGSPRPVVSNLNVNSSAAIPNLVIVPVTNGKIDFFNAVGTVNLLGDLAGYYAPVTGSQYTAVGPCRVFDTRSGKGPCTASQAIPTGALAGGHVLAVPLTGVEGVPANATAVVLNVTATGATASTFVSVYPDGTTRPTVSNLNVNSNKAVPNLVIVPVINGKVDFFNAVGSVNLLADLAGYYAP